MARVRMGAMAVAFGIQHDLDLECLVHFTTRDRNLMALESELLGAHALGVRNILALTGDPPRVGDYPTGTGVWDVDSIGLVEILARLNRGEDGAGKPDRRSRPGFTIACALDPTAADAATEWDRLERKIEAGAHLIMTQPLYDLAQVEAMVTEARRRFGPAGFPLPVLLGVLPLQSTRHAEFLHNEVPGITIPDEVRAAMREAGDRGAEVGPGAEPGAPRPGRPRSSPGPTSCPASAATSRRRAGAPTPPQTRGRRGPRVTRRTRGRRRPHPIVGVIAAIAWTMLAVGSVLGASPPPGAPPPGPPYPEPVDDQAVYDYAGVLKPETITQSEQIIDAIEAQTGVEVVVYTQAMGRDDLTTDEAAADAGALMDEWGVGQAGVDDGLVILFELDTSLEHGQVQLYAGDGFESSYLDTDARQAIFDDEMVPLLRGGDIDGAILVALGHVLKATFEPPVDPGQPAPAEPSPGPPFPDPETDRAVYDFAGILSPDAIVRAESVIDGIEARTGAEVVVYTQQTGYYGIDTAETEARARALIDQWGIGRAGFNDGMVIFFDIDPSLEHGQVQLYAAPGFEAAFLSNAERQSIFENDMVPLLRNADFDGALEVALRRVDEAATPDHAASLERARQLNAVLGLVGAPVVLLGLSRLGVPQLAAIRQGPGLPRRPVDPDAGAAARPDRRVRGDGHGRRHVPPGADDGDARSGEPRPALVPRGEGAARDQPEGRRRHRARPRATTSRRPSGRATRGARSARPRRSRSRSCARSASASRAATSRPRTCPSSGHR